MNYDEAWEWIDSHYTNDGTIEAEDVVEMAADGFEVDLSEGEAAEALADWLNDIRAN